MGRRMIVAEQTRWLGGQMTSQGVSALDEHEHMESFGGTASYREFQRRVRQYYLEQKGARPTKPLLNPGSG